MASMDNENEDSWLYGQDADTMKDVSETSIDANQIENDEPGKAEESEERKLNGTKSESNDIPAGDDADIHENDFMDADSSTVHNNSNNKSDYNDNDESGDDDDDVQVTLRNLKDIYESKYTAQPAPVQGVTPIHSSTSSSKPPMKGVDVDATGSIKGLPIYEFDLNSIKIDEKPWRKPGADITDYFNYGFTEDTWMKFCEKQRRLRLENNCRSGLIVGNGQLTGDSSNDLDATYLGLNRRQPGQRSMCGGPGLIGGTPKQTGVIDVIGGTLRDSRRPQQDFPEVSNSQSPATSIATVMPISMSIPPPMLNMPLPDFAIPPPSSLPPGALGHPVIGPTGMIGHPPILVAPPPNFAPPPMAGQYDPFFRPPMIGGPPPTALNHNADRRGVPGFPDRPTFRMDGLYGAPPPFAGPAGMPPPWDSRKIQVHPDERSSQWGRSGSHSRESEISSSSTEETGRKSREKYEQSERKSPTYSRGESRHRSRDRSSRRDYDRDRSTRDRDRDRRRDYEVSSRHHSRQRSYRDEDRSSRHYSSRSRRDKSPQDDYRSSSRYSSRKHRRERSRSSSSASDKDRRKSRSSSTEEHKK